MNTSILVIIYGLIYIPFFVVGFIVMILTIKLMRRGIVALDNYLEENQ
jgi:hypothetical protein